MSQEKVDFHKKQKANRKELVKKEKRNRFLRILLTVVIIAAAVTWFAYIIYQNNKTVETIQVETDYTALENYMNSLTN